MVLAMTLASPVFAADRCPEGVICWPDGELIHPRCIQYEWDSSDNVEEWAEHYGVDQEAISKKPGLFVRRDMDPFCPSWTSPSCLKTEMLSIVLPRELCSLEFSSVVGGSLESKIVSTNGEYAPEQYEIVRMFPTSVCENYGSRVFRVSQCFLAASYLFRRNAYSLHAVYEEKFVGPVLLFESVNRATAFIESVE